MRVHARNHSFSNWRTGIRTPTQTKTIQSRSAPNSPNITKADICQSQVNKSKTRNRTLPDRTGSLGPQKTAPLTMTIGDQQNDESLTRWVAKLLKPLLSSKIIKTGETKPSKSGKRRESQDGHQKPEPSKSGNYGIKNCLFPKLKLLRTIP